MILLRSGKKSKVDLFKELNKSYPIIIELLLTEFVYYPASNIILATDENGIMLTKKECLNIFKSSGFNSIRDVLTTFESEIYHKLGYCVIRLYICYVND